MPIAQRTQPPPPEPREPARPTAMLATDNGPVKGQTDQHLTLRPAIGPGARHEGWRRPPASGLRARGSAAFVLPHAARCREAPSGAGPCAPLTGPLSLGSVGSIAVSRAGPLGKRG